MYGMYLISIDEDIDVVYKISPSKEVLEESILGVEGI